MKFLYAIVLSFFVNQFIYANEPQPSFQLEETTIQSLQDAIKTKKTTCEAIVRSYLKRIKQYNFSIKGHPPLNAFTAINPSVINDARYLDRKFEKSNELQGSLHCVPIVINDNIDTFDITTTAGSLSLLG